MGQGVINCEDTTERWRRARPDSRGVPLAADKFVTHSDIMSR